MRKVESRRCVATPGGLTSREFAAATDATAATTPGAGRTAMTMASGAATLARSAAGAELSSWADSGGQQSCAMAVVPQSCDMAAQHARSSAVCPAAERHVADRTAKRATIPIQQAGRRTRLVILTRPDCYAAAVRCQRCAAGFAVSTPGACYLQKGQQPPDAATLVAAGAAVANRPIAAATHPARVVLIMSHLLEWSFPTRECPP